MQIRSFTQIQWRHYQKSDAVEPREKKNKTKQNNNNNKKNRKRSKYKNAVVERFTLKSTVSAFMINVFNQVFGRIQPTISKLVLVKKA